MLRVFVMGSQGLEGRQLPLGSHAAVRGQHTHHVPVLCICPLELCDTVVLGGGSQITEQGASPLHETPVPSMVTLHTAQTGDFFRKTFSRKLCGSAFRG